MMVNLNFSPSFWVVVVVVIVVVLSKEVLVCIKW